MSIVKLILLYMLIVLLFNQIKYREKMLLIPIIMTIYIILTY